MHRSSYQLTEQLIAAHAGTSVLCLADVGIGRRYRLHAARPDASLNRRAGIDGLPSGSGLALAPPKPGLIRVDISGPIAQRAGFVQEDMCAGGFVDGNDAITERLIAAFIEGDVLLYGDTPGGDPTGCQQGIAKVLAAKAKYGRRCTGFCNELIASLGVWWMASVCDEIFTPGAGVIGSIGARSGHKSIAGALEREGVVVTYFADPPAKVALAPEMPLSDVGRDRGQRDVKIVADAFRAAVCSSPLGLRGGLTPEYLIELGADALTGQAAVDAGLADGVASEDEVTAYALKMAESAQAKGTSARAHGAAMTIRAEGDEDARAGDEPPKKPDDGDGDEAKGRGIPTKCAACGVENPKAAKFCMGCSASMGTAPAEAAAARAAKAPKLSLDAGYAELAGVRADASAPVIKAALVPRVGLALRVMSAFETRDPEAALGSFGVLLKDAGRIPSLEAKLEAMTSRAKLDVGLKIAALGVEGYPRSEVIRDIVTEDGKPTIQLQPDYADLSLASLDAKYDRLKGRAPAKKAPFEADKGASEAAKDETAALLTGKGEPTKAQIETAKALPAVQDAFYRSGNTLTLDKLAEAHVRIHGAGAVQ